MPIRRLTNYAQQRTARPELWLPIGAFLFCIAVAVIFVQTKAQALFPYPQIGNFRPEPLIVLLLVLMWAAWLFVVAFVFSAIVFWIVAGCVVWKHGRARATLWSAPLLLATPFICAAMIHSIWVDALLQGPKHEQQTFASFIAKRVATSYYEEFFFPRDREAEFGGDAEWTLYWKDTIIDPCADSASLGGCRNTLVAVLIEPNAGVVVRGRDASSSDSFWVLVDEGNQVKKEKIAVVPAAVRGSDCEEVNALFELGISELLAVGDGVVLDVAQKKSILICPLSRRLFDDHADVPIAISPDRRWIVFLDRGRAIRVADTVLDKPQHSSFKIIGGPVSLDSAPADRTALPELQQAIIWTNDGIKLSAPFKLIATE
jgi:hypothetical protein